MKIIDLFSGIGGFSLGFQKAGYQFTEHYFSEIDKHAIANYKYNFPHAKHIGDITTLHGGDFTDIDIITFGSPCQDFSLAGRREGLKGAKSSLIQHAIALIADIRPSIFIWENVKGAFSSNAGADFWAILQAFANLGGYRLEWQLLNTSWLLPQNRERIYLIGHLAGRSIPGVFPIGKDDKLLDRKTRKKGWRGGNFKTSLARTITARYSKMGSYDTYIVPKVAATLTGGGHSGGLHSDMTVIQLNPSKESNGRQSYQQNRVFDERGISPALTRHNSNYAISRMRRLTEIECERLQGFSDNWTQYGDYNGTIKPIAKTQRYKLIGNAVTVDIVELIAKRLKFIKQ
ncbi:DNA cytosine methyltransferase [Capnocytophaga granulosa]|uniref:DNA cytosine methyltransferase n=1 Tax=Capnocytophaga granulosa TaxID=45242 RepID=UPI0028D2811E|nr:DNA cytosine methyltransferase [Capnocytophaga granulosa]